MVNGHKSENNVVTYGTAQGSVLGPLIYVIDVNDVLNIYLLNGMIFLCTLMTCLYCRGMLTLFRCIQIYKANLKM